MTDEPDRPDQLLIGPGGEVLGIVDIEFIKAAGLRLAYQIVAISDDAEGISDLIDKKLAEFGLETFGLIAISALRSLAEGILNDILNSTAEAGMDWRPSLRKFADEFFPQPPTSSQ